MDHLRLHADNLERELKEGEVSLGTTIVAATYEGGVVLGADSRTSTGNYVANRVTDKLTQLTDRVFVCRSGSAADTQNISAYVQYFLHQHSLDLDTFVSVKTAAKLATQLTYQNKNMLQAGLIVAGWDKQEGGSVYAVPLGGTLVKTPFSIGGSGSAYIYGWCDKNWRPGMTADDCRKFVHTAVSHAMARDGSSGGCIRTVTIDESDCKRTFTPGTQVPLHYGELQTSATPMQISAA